MGLLERYARAYPVLLAGVDERTARRLEAVLSIEREGRLWPETEVAVLLARVQGRITFEEYLELSRSLRAAPGLHLEASGSPTGTGRNPPKPADPPELLGERSKMGTIDSRCTIRRRIGRRKN